MSARLALMTDTARVCREHGGVVMPNTGLGFPWRGGCLSRAGECAVDKHMTEFIAREDRSFVMIVARGCVSN